MSLPVVNVKENQGRKWLTNARLGQIYTGADPGFFSGGGAPLRNDVTDSELKNF